MCMIIITLNPISEAKSLTLSALPAGTSAEPSKPTTCTSSPSLRYTTNMRTAEIQIRRSQSLSLTPCSPRSTTGHTRQTLSPQHLSTKPSYPCPPPYTPASNSWMKTSASSRSCPKLRAERHSFLNSKPSEILTNPIAEDDFTRPGLLTSCSNQPRSPTLASHLQLTSHLPLTIK